MEAGLWFWEIHIHQFEFFTNKTLSFFEVLINSKIAIVGRVSIDLFLVNLISYFCYAWFEMIDILTFL